MTNSRDLFESIAKDPDLWGAHERFRSAVARYLEHAKSDDVSLAENLEIRMAILRARRIRWLFQPDELFAEMQVISQHAVLDDHLRSKAQLLQAEYYVHVTSEYSKAQSDLEALVQRWANDSRQNLYAIAAYALAVVCLRLGDEERAEELAQDAASIARRTNDRLLLANSLNVHAISKRIRGRYVEAERILKRALAILTEIGNAEGVMIVSNNIGIAKMRLGEWRQAHEYYRKGAAVWEELERAGARVASRLNSTINSLRLATLERSFDRAIVLGEELISGTVDQRSRRLRALGHEFLSDVSFEKGKYDEAHTHIEEAYRISLEIAPESDLMTEVIRRRAQLKYATGDMVGARDESTRCIRLSEKVSDHHELGAASRVLAAVHVKLGAQAKAVSAFDFSINTLKTSGDTYELMRTCIAYAEFLLDNDRPDAEIYILEAKQLCSRLELDFFMSQTLMLTARLHFRNEDYTLSRTCLKEAEEIAERLQSCDRNQLLPRIKKLYKELEQTILKVGMESAEKLKTLGKLYEDSRFPIEELRPEMATDVARNVGAEHLFLARRSGKGFQVPIKYDISGEEAKRIIRMQLRNGTENLFEPGAPKVVPQTDERTLVAVTGQGKSGYALCAVFPASHALGPGEVEFLVASVNAMERVAEEYAVPRAAAALSPEGFFEGKGLKHPGGHFKDILTLDKGMIEIIHLTERASSTDVPILLQGETGCGKELFAQAIHSQSRRSEKPFVAMNAGGLPVNLFESQLFGHVKGAFTDAVRDRTGLVEDARGGTLFLDEVGEMGEEAQVKLLRLLETGEYRRLGENEMRRADVRVVSATNKDLEKRVGEGQFREDLYYRLATVSFHIPPLRQRKRDVELLVRHFLKEGLAQIGRPNDLVHFDVKALEAFELYHWPGNVRELKNEIMRNLSLLGGGEVIRFGMLSDKIKRAFEAQENGGMLTARVDRFEKRLILKALEENEWNRVRTAEEIGIPRTTLLFKMRKLNIIQ